MKKPFATLLLLTAALFPAPGAVAQTAAELERVLALPAVSCGDAARFVLGAAGTALPETAKDSAAGAYRFATERGWLPEKAAAEEPASLGDVSFLIMRALNIEGGLMYSLFPGPRYAYRELAYLKIIRGRSYSTMTVSGQRLLRIISRALDYAGDTAAPAPAAIAETGPPANGMAAPPVPSAPPALMERERVVEIIHTELEEKHVSDTDVRVTDEGVTISLNNIQFLPDSTELMEAEKQNLQNIAAILNKFPKRKILVGGHTAMAGSVEGRMRVSIARARAVADYLVSLGCRKSDEITVRAYGAGRPLGDPATAAGQVLNRRVEITLLDDEVSGDE
jgi:outer membrane protein OmpA-like peptidoglycan-associated protein